MAPLSESLPRRKFPQPLDRVAIALMLLLSLLIGLLFWSGDRSAPRIRSFNWQDSQVGAMDEAFVLTFSRPMEQATVEKNLKITPPLPGKFSWAGRRMAYTLTVPAPYGNAYEVRLQGAQDRFKGEGSQRATNEPFIGRFRTRDRAFAYIGVQGEEEGRLILYNLTQQQKQVLTPPTLSVMDFKPYPDGDRILFSATERSTTQSRGMVDQQLYTVTTGIHNQPPQPSTPEGFDWFGLVKPAPKTTAKSAGEIVQVLDSRDYQNLKFDLSADGTTIVVQRVSRKNPADFGPWIVRQDANGNGAGTPIPLGGQPGGDFLITPDSSSLAIAQGEGLALLPLQPDAQPLDFLPKFGMVLSFSKDGSQAAMVKFNKDYTRSLFLVTNQGVQNEVLRITGSILDAQFDPQKQTLYCLLTELLKGETYQEQPYLAMVDLKTSKVTPLLMLPVQRDIQMSLAPDSLGLLFDQTTVQAAAQPSSQRTSDGQAITTSRLWLLPLVPGNPAAQATVKPEELPLPGFHPTWLP